MKLLRNVITFLAALAAWGQTPVELRVDNETAPPGGVVQIKIGLTDPHPISIGQVAFSFPSDTFDSIFGVNLYSAAGDVAGAAVVQGANITTRFNSPLENLGVGLDYPILTIVSGIKPTAQVGSTRTIQPDLSSFLKALLGADIPYTLKPGTLTVGGSLYVSNIVPGGGLLPAGSIVKVIGGGFTPNTQVTINELLLSKVEFKSANEIWVTTAAAGEMTSRRVTVKEGGAQVVYYSYLRTTPLGSSTRVLLNRTEPIFTATRSLSATIPGTPAAGTGLYAGLALQNDNLGAATVSMDLVSSTGAVIGHWVENLPSAARYVRDLAELFGTTPPVGSKAVITSSSPVKVLGLAANDATGVVNPVIPTAGATPQLAALPTALNFSAQQGGAAPTPQSLNVIGIGAALGFNATASTPWLLASAASGITPLTLTIAVNPTGLATGTYNGTITLSAAGVANYQVPVTLTVSPPSGLAANPSQLLFTTAVGGAAPAAQQTTITGGGALSVSVSPVPWLSASASGNVVTVSVNPAGLATGTYVGTVFVQSGGAQLQIPVTFNVTGTVVEGARFIPVTPCRAADTRAAGGILGGPSMSAGATRSFFIPGSACGIPTGALAYSLNITVVPHGPLAFLTAWPSSQPRPLVSTLNAFDGAVTSNAAIVPASSSGEISVFVTDATDVILDINGYFVAGTPANGLNFFPATPCRVADTRNANGTFGGPFLAAGTTRDFPVPASGCGIPASAQAYSVNVTVVPRGPLGFLTTWPAGQPRPNVSTLNSFGGTIKANAAIVPAGTGGAISVYVTDAADVILDINGYFAAGPSGLRFYALTPCRLADTRNPTGPFGGPILGAGAARDFAFIFGSCGVPNFAQAFSTNVTVVPAGGLAFLTAWPAGLPRPVVSTLNSFEGKILANAAIIPAGNVGSASFFVTDQTHVIIDVNGYFEP